MKVEIGEHIIKAMRSREPLVALETAVITHGLPQPINVETGLAMEAAICATGAIPCTIGVLHGTVIIGMVAEQLQALSQLPDPVKIGVRELPLAAALTQSGGTTVAATAYLAHRYGIRVFATGGIGGVHRGAATTFDISGDLITLGKTPITVVSSGAKAILDLQKTLEYLETMGVSVVGYRTNTFPAFYASTSPYLLALQVDSVADVASAALARDELALPSALLVCNPVACDAEIPFSELMELIKRVDEELDSSQVQGQNVTPEMLRRLSTLTQGKTLQTNVRLLEDNARLSGEIAIEIARQL
ncbi:MAG: pseudouridine-5'-phosphate glycosidase [Firmicutes bacterium]|nr:pseudouridine-5'-phosphate glycosidase [Bacillota bacterium]